MGHIIIICQALVHACTQEDEEDDDDDDETKQTEGEKSATSAPNNRFIKRSTSNVSRSSADSGAELSREPLFLAEMVACHPLSDRWHEFVSTTLANETAIQSTPLGGYNSAAAASEMLPHRPGMPDDDMDALELPPRGMLGGIDMDENDLDIAASMMAGLSMGRVANGDGDSASSGSSGYSDRSYNSGETNNSGGYLFDDPLGKVNSGLGIELGKLTKLVAGDSKTEEDNDDDSSSSSSSHSSASSSDEEEDRADSDVPVMDLFAGNFNVDEPSTPTAEASQEWSNFANFDDAFTASQAPAADEDDFGPFSDAAADSTAGAFASRPKADEEELDEMFGPADKTNLLEMDLDELTPNEGAPNGEHSEVKPQEETTPDAFDPAIDGEVADYEEDIKPAPSDELKADLNIKLANENGPTSPEEVPQPS
jgi:hypothetical protein